MDLYNVTDVAKMLNVNEETVRRWIRDGRISAQRALGRIGNTMRLDEIVDFANKTPRAYLQSLESWLKQNCIEYERIYDTDPNSNSSKALTPALAGAIAGIAGASPAAVPIVMGTGFCASKAIKKKNYQPYIIKILSQLNDEFKESENIMNKIETTSDSGFSVEIIEDSFSSENEDYWKFSKLPKIKAKKDERTMDSHPNTETSPSDDLTYNSILDAIARAKKLLDEDIISNEEFKTIKTKLIAKL